ncbi:aminopeptidase N-like [Glandiceps talaboti]
MAKASSSKYASNGRLMEDPENGDKKGCFVSKTAAISIVVVVILITTGAVLITYFAVECSENSGTLPTHDPYEGLPKPVEEEDYYEYFEGRIPDTLAPVNYVIKITPYFDEEDGQDRFLFDGELDFEVKCEKTTREIKIHIYNITIHDETVRVVNKDGSTPVDIINKRIQEKYEFYIIETGEDLIEGENYIISLEYKGNLKQPTVGLYLSTYTMADGVQRYLAATQLQATDARRMFPCFDEPNLKATFDMIIKHRKRRHAIANTAIYLNETDGDWVTTYFEKTVVMSTYLNAIVVSDFVYKENVTRDGVLFRVWCRPDAEHTLDYSLMVGSTMLDFYGDHLNIPYNHDDKMTKMDMAAIPQFSAGAMENWGLILYREERMLFDPEVDLASKQQRIARIIGHEIVHQWFGNLVTCGWWSDLWLNEGYARFLEDAGVHRIHPEWAMYDQFYPRDATFKALDADSISSSSRPVIKDVGWNSEIMLTFDRMSYEKGAGMNMMMMHFLGNITFRDGLEDYLREHAYSPVFSDDLFTALTNADAEYRHTNVKMVMDTFTLQAGYPVVTLTRDGNSIHAEQEHFLQYAYDEPNDKHDDLGYVWYVPLTWTDGEEQEFTSECSQNIHCNFMWMNKLPADFTITTGNIEQWFIVNINQNMYYRVNYENENWELLAEQLKTDHKVLPIRNRGALISDAFNIGKSQRLDHVIALKVIEYLTAERDYNPLLTTRDNLRYTVTMLWRMSTYGYFERYLRQLISPIYEELGWNFKKALEDDHIDYHNRVITVEMACNYGNLDCIANATDQYSVWMDKPDENLIREDTKTTVYCTAISHGSDKEWQFAFDQHLLDADEKTELQRAMACSRNSYTLQGYMEYYLETSEARTVIGYVKDESGIGFDLAWNFVIDNFDDLHQRFGDSTYDTVWSFANTMNTEKDKMKMENFGKTYHNMPGTAANNYYESLQRIQGNIEWIERNGDEIKTWLIEVIGKTTT